MSRKILVTGSNGLLGQKITDLILKTDQVYQLTATSVGENRHPIKTGYKYRELDITDKAQVLQVIADEKPSFVINTAAMTNVDACEANQADCKKLNVDAVNYLISACEQNGTHLIHISTDFIFDGKKGPYSETDLPNPLSYYGQSKLDSEHEILASNCNWTILRTILVYGVVADMSRSNIVLWAKSQLEKGEKISAVNDQWRMPTLAEDLAAACLKVIEHQATGIYNISGKELLSIVELIEEIADFWSLDKRLIRGVNTSSLGQKAPRPMRTGFKLDKACSELGYLPTSFRDGLTLVEKQLNTSLKLS